MDSIPSDEITVDFFPFFRTYKDGRIHRYNQPTIVPATDDPITGIRSKDVVVSPDNNVSARLFLPGGVEKDEKLPVLVYIHGGAFVIESAFSSQYHSYMSSVAAEAKVLALSVEYRLAPEHPIPACFEDSWAALKWVESHAKDRQGPEPWINNHADFTRIYVAGDSAGGNIAHNTVSRASSEGLEDGMKIVGMILAHPYFGSGQTEKLWDVICSDSDNKGTEDPRLNPMAHPNLLSNLKCDKVLICTGEKDFIRDRSWLYYEALKKSGWSGQLEIFDYEGEGHVFHLLNPNCDNAGIYMKQVVSFLKD